MTEDDRKFYPVSWSGRIIHLYFKEDYRLSDDLTIPKGTLCGRKPTRKICTINGVDKYLIRYEFNSIHLRSYRKRLCKDCAKKIYIYGMQIKDLPQLEPSKDK